MTAESDDVGADDLRDVAAAFEAWDDMEHAEELARTTAGTPAFGDRAEKRRDRRTFGDELDSVRDRDDGAEDTPPQPEISTTSEGSLTPAALQIAGLVVVAAVGCMVVIAAVDTFGSSPLAIIGGAFGGVLGMGGTWRAYERLVYERVADDG